MILRSFTRRSPEEGTETPVMFAVADVSMMASRDVHPKRVLKHIELGGGHHIRIELHETFTRRGY